jgi:hypothetical protein
MDVPKLRPKEQLHLDEKCLNDNLGKGNTIFVGSSTDMWAQQSQEDWINRVLDKCIENKYNTYVFQTKNPHRFVGCFLLRPMPEDSLYGCTIESDIHSGSKSIYCPTTFERYYPLSGFPRRTFISIEPIMDFTWKLLEWMAEIKPVFVSIGANSRRDVNLPEPPPEKINELILELRKFTKVKVKDNLKRLLPNKEVPRERSM